MSWKEETRGMRVCQMTAEQIALGRRLAQAGEIQVWGTVMRRRALMGADLVYTDVEEFCPVLAAQVIEQLRRRGWREQVPNRYHARGRHPSQAREVES